MDPLKEEIARQVDGIAGDLFSLSTLLYENPETAYHEHQACTWLGRFCAERNFEVETGVGGVETAFLARPAGVDRKGPVVAFLAEYDALEKIGHGCGHNLIAAISLGAAVALGRAAPHLRSSFVIIGTPAEEGGGGKARLMEARVFDGIDASVLVHPGHRNFPGEDTLGRIKATVEFFGRTAHAAAAPESGLNALDALVGAYNNINALRQQTTTDARIHGIITHGGDAPNVIPDYTRALFYVRSARSDYLRELFGRFEDCCKGAAMAAGCRVEVRVQPPSLEPMKRNFTLERVWIKNLEALGLASERKEGPSGSTDAGNLSRLMPVIQPFMGICDEHVLLHSEAFADATQTERARKALLDGAGILAMTVYDYLTSPKIQASAAEEFNSR